MSTFLRLTLRIFLGLALLCAALPAGRAQSGVGDIVYTVGTVTRDTHNRDWAYILWQATQPALLSNRVFAVYAKPGDSLSGAPFVRQSIVWLQTDGRVIEPLLRRAENLGDDLGRLGEELGQLFGNLVPSNVISRAEQLSAVIRGSLDDARNYQNLLLLARNHAGVNLAMGFADAQLIGPGMTTFEVRAYDMTTDQDLAVIGRVTVEAGNPTVLPQPGPPVVVPETSPMGDLNVKLRWGTPDPLRRLGLIQFGYNLYRVNRVYAESQGWNTGNPPPFNVLSNLVKTAPHLARRINRAPITPSRVFTVAEAANTAPPTGDTNTTFVMDDDGRGRFDYINLGFTNGAQFYYYVTARDVLGRDGLLSPGLLATVCDRMPPLPPTSVRVANEYTYNRTTRSSNLAFRVTWKQSPNTNDITTNYWIYRWTSVTQMHAMSGNSLSNLVAVVPHVRNSVYNSYLDIGATAPNVASNLGQTFWYTVRAGDAGACSQNLSGHAGPAYGVLRDREGPPAGNGFVEINCLRPQVRHRDTKYPILTNGPDLVNFNFQFNCERLHERFEWVEFFCILQYGYQDAGYSKLITNETGRLYFNGSEAVSAWWSPPIVPDGQKYSRHLLYVVCRAGMSNGKMSESTAEFITQMPNDRSYAQLNFEAMARLERVLAGENDRECREHEPGGNPSGPSDIGIHIIPSPGSTEYRVYRRVDDGPLSLLSQGPITNLATVIDCYENAMPANGGTICFFLQLLDEHGNPSPMTPIKCVETAPNSPLPVPVMGKITSAGDLNNAGMNLYWFCPPYGVERFEVRVAGLPTAPNTNGFNLSSKLTFAGGAPISMTFSNFGTNLTLPFYSFLTPKVGAGFGNEGAQFQVPCTIQLGKTYVVAVRAMGKNDNAGQFSKFETFAWNPPTPPVQEVPWPARGLPSVNASFTNTAVFLSPTNGSPIFRTIESMGVGVWIGYTPVKTREFTVRKRVVEVSEDFDPNQGLVKNSAGESIFPCVLYRYQVPNANFPTTSGDIIQVSPLMEQIAYERSVVTGQSTNTIIHDPFVAVTVLPGNQGGNVYYWLRDSQPQISGARYKYVLVRFKPNREIDQIIPSNEVEVP